MLRAGTQVSLNICRFDENLLTVILDGMDQSKSSIPSEAESGHKIFLNFLGSIHFRILGLIVHKKPVQRYCFVHDKRFAGS